jgi:4-hydroxy-4-methyl-2-oxoglutarate aldolase
MERFMTSSVEPDRSLLEYLKTVDTPTLSNAIELLNVRKRNEGFAPLQLRCLFPELGRMCGYAVTAQVETVTQANPDDRSIWLRLYEAIDAAPKPSVVVFQELGGLPDFAAHAGEVMCSVFARLGTVGLVSDCAIRDIPEVRALGFHYFARGATASHAYIQIVRVQLPVQVLGLPILPGDVLHGDENGLLVVPREGRDRLPEAVDTVRKREKPLLDLVRSPQFSVQDFMKLFG